MQIHSCSSGLGTLMAVPSIHFRCAFAFEVNRACALEENAPDAIAVELGEATAQSARAWIGELTAGDGQSKQLPILFGLLSHNRRIRASMRERTFEMQRRTGRTLEAMSPDTLYQDLGFTGMRVLYLSPTDSIIEAIRCSCELGVPLYGVDLEEVADDRRSALLLPDSWSVDGDVDRYIEDNAQMAASNYDEETDARREYAIAARLRAVLERHSRVLFVCGLGHWARLRRMLADDSIRPAVLPAANRDQGEFQKTVVDRALALQAFDVAPPLAALYETRRRTAGAGAPPEPIRAAEVERMLAGLVGAAARKQFETPAGKAVSGIAGAESIALFDRYLRNLCLVSGRQFPEAGLILRSAHLITGAQQFVKALTELLFDVPWVDPASSSLPYLRHTPGNGPARTCEIESEGSPFWLRTSQGGLHSTEPTDRTLLSGTSSGGRLVRAITYGCHTWGPWDYLVSALSIRALEKARRLVLMKESAKFEGGRVMKVDTKTTVRSLARGDDDLFVFHKTPVLRTARLKLDEYDPVVWILGNDPKQRPRFGLLSMDLSKLRLYARDPVRYEAECRSRYSTLVCILQATTRPTDDAHTVSHPDIRTDLIHGLVLFQPICWTLEQFTRWTEVTAFRRNPFQPFAESLFSRGPEELREFAPDAPGVEWTSTLIAGAMPYAQRRVVCVAAADFTVPDRLKAIAQNRGIRIEVVRSSGFDPAHLARLRYGYMTPLSQEEPDYVYPAWVEEAIGESQYKYSDLVPDAWLHFGATVRRAFPGWGGQA